MSPQPASSAGGLERRGITVTLRVGSGLGCGSVVGIMGLIWLMASEPSSYYSGEEFRSYQLEGG